jgi:hypothetical protein
MRRRRMPSGQDSSPVVEHNEATAAEERAYAEVVAAGLRESFEPLLGRISNQEIDEFAAGVAFSLRLLREDVIGDIGRKFLEATR